MKLVLFLCILSLVIVMIIICTMFKSYEHFGDDALAMQMGNNQLETVMRMESDVAGITTTQESLTRDFGVLQKTTTTKLGEYSGRLDTMQKGVVDKVNKMSDVQDSQGQTLLSLTDNLDGMGKKVVATNNDLNVFNGRLIDLSNRTDAEMSDVKNSVGQIRDRQTQLKNDIVVAAESLSGSINQSIRDLERNFGSQFVRQESSVQQMSKSVGDIGQQLNALRDDQKGVNTSTQNRINDINSQTSAVANDIKTAQQKLNDVQSMFDAYVKQSSLNGYVRQEALNAYATKTDLQSYVVKGDLAAYASLNELQRYTPSSDFAQLSKTLTDAQNALTSLQGVVNVINRSYVSQEAFTKGVTGLQNSVDVINRNYVSQEAFTKGVTGINQSLGGLQSSVDTINRNYVSQETFSKVTGNINNLSNLATTVTNLSSALDTLKNSLQQNYYTRTDVDTQLKNYVRPMDMSNFVRQEQFVRRNELPAQQNLADVVRRGDIGGIITAEQLVRRNEIPAQQNLADVVRRGDIGGILSSEQLVKSQALNDYAKKAEINGMVDPRIQAARDVLQASIDQVRRSIVAIENAQVNQFQVNDTLRVNQIKATPGRYGQPLPDGWGGGVHTLDLWANGTIGVGENKEVRAYMANNGQIVGRRIGGTRLVSGGDPSGEAWIESWRADGSVLVGADNGTRGIRYSGNRPFTISGWDDKAGFVTGLSMDNGSMTLSRPTVNVVGNLNINGTNSVTSHDVFVRNSLRTAGDNTQIDAAGRVQGRRLVSAAGPSGDAWIESSRQGESTIIGGDNNMRGIINTGNRAFQITTPRGVGFSMDDNNVIMDQRRIRAQTVSSVGNPDGWNWFHALRKPNEDELFFGGDNTNRGIWSVGDRPVAIYTHNSAGFAVDKDNVTLERPNINLRGTVRGTGWMESDDLNGRVHVRAGGDKAWMRNDGTVYAGNWLDAQNVQGRDHVRAGGNWQAWMRNDGNGQFTDTLSVGGKFHPDSVRGWGWKFSVQNNDNQVFIAHKDGDGVQIKPNNQAADKSALNIDNGQRRIFQVRNNGEMWMNDGSLYLRNPDGHDKNHGLSYRGDLDGPALYGFNGGSLSVPATSSTGNPNSSVNLQHVAQWNRNNQFIVNGSFLNRSDARAKENIKPLSEKDTEKLKELRPVEYKWKNGNTGKQTGFIAQDVEKVYPHLVSTDSQGNKNLNYVGMLPMVVSNLQEVNKMVRPTEKKLCIDEVCLTKDDIIALKEGTSMMKNAMQ